MMKIDVVIKGKNVERYNKVRAMAENDLGKGITHDAVFGYLYSQYEDLKNEYEIMESMYDDVCEKLEAKQKFIEKLLEKSVSAPRLNIMSSSPQINTKIASFAPQPTPIPSGPPSPPPPRFQVRTLDENIVEDEYEPSGLKEELKVAVEYGKPKEVFFKIHGKEYEPPPLKKKMISELRNSFNPFYFPQKNGESERDYNTRLGYEKKKIDVREKDKKKYLEKIEGEKK